MNMHFHLCVSIYRFGDLNYRINEIISTQLVFDTVLRGEFKSLLYKDQLINERLAGTVFEDYDEGTHLVNTD
jgi:hypothetical protein